MSTNWFQNSLVSSKNVPISCCSRTGVSAQGVKALSPLTVRCVDVAVSSPGTDQDGSSTLRALHEGQVPDGTVMHAELQVWAWIRGAHSGQKHRVPSTGDHLNIGLYRFRNVAGKTDMTYRILSKIYKIVPVALQLSALKGRTLTYLSLEPVANSCPQWLQATQ